MTIEFGRFRVLPRRRQLLAMARLLNSARGLSIS